MFNVNAQGDPGATRSESRHRIFRIYKIYTSNRK